MYWRGLRYPFLFVLARFHFFHVSLSVVFLGFNQASASSSCSCSCPCLFFFSFFFFFFLSVLFVCFSLDFSPRLKCDVIGGVAHHPRRQEPPSLPPGLHLPYQAVQAPVQKYRVGGITRHTNTIRCTFYMRVYFQLQSTEKSWLHSRKRLFRHRGESIPQVTFPRQSVSHQACENLFGKMGDLGTRTLSNRELGGNCKYISPHDHSHLLPPIRSMQTQQNPSQ
jgi:hypothetical protein